MTNKEAIEQLKLQTQWSIDLICSVEALEVAIEALEKQIPKKPIRKNNVFGCVSCRHIVSSVQNYCEHCGQAIDWTEVE